LIVPLGTYAQGLIQGNYDPSFALGDNQVHLSPPHTGRLFGIHRVRRTVVVVGMMGFWMTHLFGPRRPWSLTGPMALP